MCKGGQNISAYLNGVSKCDRTKQNKNIPLSSIDFKWFLRKYRQNVMGVEHEEHVKGGAGKKFPVAVSRAPRVPRACLRSPKKAKNYRPFYRLDFKWLTCRRCEQRPF